MNRNIIVSILVALALIAGVAGVGAVAFRAGVTYGIAQSGEVAAAIENGKPFADGIPYG